jgi:hypothetical protein
LVNPMQRPRLLFALDATQLRLGLHRVLALLGL